MKAETGKSARYVWGGGGLGMGGGSRQCLPTFLRALTVFFSDR